MQDRFSRLALPFFNSAANGRIDAPSNVNGSCHPGREAQKTIANRCGF
jgi:hypothetical protein